MLLLILSIIALLVASIKYRSPKLALVACIVLVGATALKTNDHYNGPGTRPVALSHEAA